MNNAEVAKLIHGISLTDRINMNIEFKGAFSGDLMSDDVA